MFVSRLEMIGFKSFASRTQLEFRPGVMAVVGPNGCGKTNIVDAIRWVLGEQRSGVLRADRMDAVIFNGTNKRRPVGMAEVSLVIDNDKGRLPSPFTEVALTRRLFRSGESEYLINRNPSRLRDIYDLFTDTGFGHSAYSIIELAMVEGIITGPSESRRKLLEEAAGVAKFKTRRIAAKRRLDSTTENLQRIEDIYTEVQKRYNALRRQAARTRKYQALAKAVEIKLLVELADERIDLVDKRQPIEVELAELEESIQDSEDRNVRAASDLLALEAEELNLLDKTNRLSDTLKRLERREAEMRGELALAKQRIGFIKTEQARDAEARGKLRESLDNEKNSGIETERIITELNSSKTKTESELAKIEIRISGFKQAYDTTYKKLSDTRNREEQIQKELRAIEADAASRDSEQHHLERQIKRLETESDAFRLRIDTLTKELSRKKIELDESEKQANGKRSSLSELQTALELKRAQLAELLSQKARLKADVETASSLLASHRARASTSVGWSDALRSRLISDNLTPLNERIQCQPQHRAAIAAALNPILDAIEQPSLDRAFDLSKSIESSERLVLHFPVNGDETLSVPEIPTGYEDCVPGVSMIQNDDDLGVFLRRWLCNLVVVPDRQALHELAGWAAENNIRLVSMDGELVEPDGIYYSGSLDPEGFQIGWKNRLDELEKQLQETERALDTVGRSVDSAAGKLNACEGQTKLSRNELRHLEDSIASLGRSCAALESDKTRLVKNRSDLEREIKAFQKRLDALRKTGDSSARYADMKKTLVEAESDRRLCEQAFIKVEGQKVDLVEDRASISTELSRITERIRSVKEAYSQSERESASRQSNLAALEAKIAQSESEMDRVIQAEKNLSAQIELLVREKEQVTENTIRLKEQKANFQKRRQDTKRTLDQSQLEQKEVIRRRSKIEADLIGLRERMRELDRRLIEETGIEPSSIDSSTAVNAEAELAELGYGDVPLEKLRIRLSSLGPVNMLAIEEIKTVEERYAFLKDQKQDLEKGIELLEETIERINIEARRKFRETFEKVNHNFQELFRVLFEGGEARIQLEGLDPLEADIRIWATPSGKKLRSLSMLSGGEKALTAIALLFAIYQVRPSPFCILDEVDAPLDDANILRFNRLIARFSTDTQFLVVTHNKRTMEAANSLFGVTLGEDGTSHLVSVKIEKKEQHEIVE